MNDPITAARAAALFVSHLSATAQPTDQEVAAAIRHALLSHGGSRACAADVAAEYGDHPELAVVRMRWARTLVDEVFGAARPVAAHPSRRASTLAA